ncbi:MAG: TfoX/Sxy family protein [Candidatus Margulisiibacteriota bacterium]
MSTRKETIDYLLDQLAQLGGIMAKKMFGEYALYLEGKVIALVCDDQLYVKITPAGRQYLEEDVCEAPAYSGAKPSFLIDEDRWEDPEWLCGLFACTLPELPEPKPKRSSKRPD